MKKFYDSMNFPGGVSTFMVWFFVLGLVLAFPQSTFAQEAAQTGKPDKYVIMGNVTARSTKEPLVGVKVNVEGTKLGTATNEKGEYILMVDRKLNQTLVFSYVGMETKKVVFNGQTHIDVVLYEKAESLDDVVVTGYATINKEGFAGSFTSISREEITKVSPNNILTAIQVYDPSFRLMENIAAGSNPNAMPEYYLRGQSAINTELSMGAESISRQNLANNRNLPIFILDGFEVSMEKIYDMDPSRIHKVSILKDAAATALYGSRAGNGVIVIETRAPQPGKLNIEYKFTGTLETPDLSGYNLMNAREKLQAEVDAGFYSFNPDQDTDFAYIDKVRRYTRKLSAINNGVDTDWLAQGVRNSFGQRHNLVIDGGENDVRWGVDLRYANNAGVMVDSKRETYGATIKIDYRIGSFQIMNTVDYNGMKSTDSPFGSFSNYSHKQPYDPVRDPVTGKYLRLMPSYDGATEAVLINPLYESAYLNSFVNNNYNDFTEQLQVRWNISPDFFLQGRLMFEKKVDEDNAFVDPYSVAFARIKVADEIGSLTVGNRDKFVYDANIQASYNTRIKQHYINATLNTSFREENGSYISSEYVGFPSSSTHSISDAAKLLTKPSKSTDKIRSARVNAYLNYTYNNIYLLDANFSMDGSSEFATDKKIAPFGSVAAGINIHNYSFMENSVFSQLKIRGSYGTVGRISNLLSASRNLYHNISQEEWFVTGPGYILSSMGNTNLGWEKTKIADAAIEIGLFNDRVYAKAEFYNKLTEGMITTVTLPSSSGFTTYWDNIGQVRNRGVELDLRYVAIDNKNWHLSFMGKMAANRNKILKLSDAMKAYNDMVDKQYADYNDDPTERIFAKTYTKFTEGGSTPSIFAVRSLGIDPGCGKELYLKNDGTVTYEWMPSDMAIVGDTEPDASGSFGFNARWKNFDLFTSFYYTLGGEKYNQTLVDYVENVNMYASNADKRVGAQRWMTPGDVTSLKDIADRYNVTRPTSRFVQKDNTLQFLSLDLGYNFNRELLKKWNISTLRISATLQDLGYWSSIQRERGLDYPYAKTYNFSVKLTF